MSRHILKVLAALVRDGCINLRCIIARHS